MFYVIYITCIAQAPLKNKYTTNHTCIYKAGHPGVPCYNICSFVWAMVGWVTSPFFSFRFLKASVLCTCISMQSNLAQGTCMHTQNMVSSPFRISRQILPSLSMFGWYILVRKRTFGGAMGYSSGRKSSSLNVPASYGDYIRDNRIEQVKLNRLISYMCIYTPVRL